MASTEATADAGPAAPPAAPLSVFSPEVEGRLMQAVEEYRAALKAGAKPDRQALLARYADLAGPLAECLDALEFGV